MYPSLGDLGYRKSRVATGIDAREGLQVHVDVQGEPVEAAAPAYPKTQGRDLRALQVDTRGTGTSGGLDPVTRQQLDDGLLQQLHKALDAESGTVQVEQKVGDELTRSMVSDLTAAVGLDDGDVAWIQDVLATPGLTEGVDRAVLQKPELVGRIRAAPVGEGLHRRQVGS
jgi:hypothetical protein